MGQTQRVSGGLGLVRRAQEQDVAILQAHDGADAMIDQRKSLLALKREARHAVQQRGHRLGAWIPSHAGRACAECAVCGAWVTVNRYPMPNEIEVGGSAVAIECRVKA